MTNDKWHLYYNYLFYYVDIYICISYIMFEGYPMIYVFFFSIRKTYFTEQENFTNQTDNNSSSDICMHMEVQNIP